MKRYEKVLVKIVSLTVQMIFDRFIVKTPPDRSMSSPHFINQTLVIIRRILNKFESF